MIFVVEAHCFMIIKRWYCRPFHMFIDITKLVRVQNSNLKLQIYFCSPQTLKRQASACRYFYIETTRLKGTNLWD